jgi:hypothetical protein
MAGCDPGMAGCDLGMAEGMETIPPRLARWVGLSATTPTFFRAMADSDEHCSPMSLTLTDFYALVPPFWASLASMTATYPPIWLDLADSFATYPPICFELAASFATLPPIVVALK